MPTVIFDASEAGPATTVEVAGRHALVDVCDESHAPVGFSCRGATCTTCRVLVLEGLDLLEAPGDAERDLLASIGAATGLRLACQAVVREGDGRVRLAWLGPLVPAP